MNPPPFGLPETLYFSDSGAKVPPGHDGWLALTWDGQAWVGTAAFHELNLGCEAC